MPRSRHGVLGILLKQLEAIGLENLGKPRIKAAIDARLKALADKRIAKADEVLKFLTATLRGEVKDVQIVVEGTGDGCSKASLVETRASVRDRIEAAKNQGRIPIRYGCERAAAKAGQARTGIERRWAG